MTLQLTFDHVEALAKRDRAIVDVEAAQHGLWLLQAVEAVERVARRQLEFCADEVWEELQASGALTPTNPSAIGPVMLRARARGICVPTGRYRTSRRVATNARRLPVWRSTLLEGAANDNGGSAR